MLFLQHEINIKTLSIDFNNKPKSKKGLVLVDDDCVICD